VDFGRISPLWCAVAAGAILLSSLVSLSAPRRTPQQGYRTVREFPHDPKAFTQGLIYLNGALYESTGLEGHSSLRKVHLETGRVLQEIKIPDRFFAEGLTDWQQCLVQLTWQSHIGFVYGLFNFEKLREFSYPGEGWGLTHDGKNLIMSDGSSTLRYLDPVTYQTVRMLHVTADGSAVNNLNELEYVRGEIYANIWESDAIARISPVTGNVLHWVDMTGLLSAADRAGQPDVLNGIAYDRQNDRLFVTGKLWPKLFEIKIVDR
jgi:glutaminyl-peptide cyclotransferase